MRHKTLLAAFVSLNIFSAFLAHTLWNTSSMAAGSAILALIPCAALGGAIGGWLAAKNLYRGRLARVCFAAAAGAVPVVLLAVVNGIDHPAETNGPFPTSPWHQFGFLWLYFVISTLWLHVQATKSVPDRSRE